jgi:hypothetical protein
MMMQKSIQKSASPVSTAGMYYQTGGLIYDDYTVILVKNVERDILGRILLPREISLRGNLNLLTAPHFLLGARTQSIYDDMPLQDP